MISVTTVKSIKKRARLVDADDLERFTADHDGVVDFLGCAVGIGVIAGDLGTDQHVRLSHVVHLEESPAPLLRRQQSLLVHAALEVEMLGKRLPLDQDRLRERAEPLVAFLREELRGRAREQVLAIESRADPPDLRGHDPGPADLPQVVDQLRGQVAEDGRG